MLRVDAPTTVVWSSIFTRHPTAVIEFDIVSDGAGGTDLCWTLLVDDLPSEAAVGHLRRRMNELINRDLRLSFGQ